MSQAQPSDDRPTESPTDSVQPAASVRQSEPSAGQQGVGHKVASFFRMVGQLLSIVLSLLSLAFNLLRGLTQLILKGLKGMQGWWAVILPQLRSRLPEPWKTKLPEQVLTAIALLFLLSFLAITFALLPGKPPALVKAPSVSAPEPPGLLVPPPESAVSLDRLTKIQDQLAEIAAPYAVGLVESVQASPRHSRLQVTLGNDWYALEPAQQDKLANEVLKRSHKLKFDHLELTDTEGVLLARSPVVGSGILILERTTAVPQPKILTSDS